MHTSPLWAIWWCDHTQLCWLGSTDTVTPPTEIDPLAAGHADHPVAGTPAASITRTVS